VTLEEARRNAVAALSTAQAGVAAAEAAEGAETAEAAALRRQVSK
jgi:hypothetical protein